MSHKGTQFCRRSLLQLSGSSTALDFSEAACAAAAEPKELVIIPGAVHTDLCDRTDVIPFDKLTAFFTRNLGGGTVA